MRLAFLALILSALWHRDATARDVVVYRGEAEPGSILVKSHERRLYFIQRDGTAIRYPVAVGRTNKLWTGVTKIIGKHVEPAWSPPDEIKGDHPSIPNVIPGGSARNPMGARALTLSGDGEYAIHGTNRRQSIGTFASYGCIRMYNEDIIDLFDRVALGATVVVAR